jgi:hypothetical protein
MEDERSLSSSELGLKMSPREEKVAEYKCEPENNPWVVNQLEDFLFYCCPECSDRSQTKETFINHALFQHPLARDTIPAIEAENETLFDLPENHNDIGFKTELTTEETYDVSNEELDEIVVDKVDPLIGTTTKKKRKLAVKDNENTNKKKKVNRPPRIKKTKEPVQCDQCTKSFQCAKSLAIHMRTSHSDERPFACDKCEFRTKRSGILQRHIERIHKKLANHMCNHCSKTFYTSYELKLHADKCVVDQTLSGVELEYCIQLCDKCDRTFESLKALRQHRTRTHKITENPTFCCDKCNKVMTTVNYMKIHMKAEHPTDEQIVKVGCNCEKCSLNFPNSIELDRHFATCHKDHHRNATLKCENCEIDNWHSNISLRKHYAEVHRKIWEICDICNKVLKNTSLKWHKQVVHTGVKEFTCQHCGKSFSLKCGLQTHIKGVHGKNIAGEYRFKCDKCDYTTVAEYRLKEHNEATHIREVKYNCDQCNYFGYRKLGLQSHISAVHNKLKRHKCDHCEIGFYYKRDQIKHMEKQHSNKC